MRANKPFKEPLLSSPLLSSPLKFSLHCRRLDKFVQCIRDDLKQLQLVPFSHCGGTVQISELASTSYVLNMEMSDADASFPPIKFK